MSKPLISEYSVPWASIAMSSKQFCYLQCPSLGPWLIVFASGQSCYSYCFPPIIRLNLAQALSKFHIFPLLYAKLTKNFIVFPPFSHLTEWERKTVCTAPIKGTFTNMYSAALKERHTLKSQQREFGGWVSSYIALEAQTMVAFVPALDYITYASYLCDYQVVFWM